MCLYIEYNIQHLLFNFNRELKNILLLKITGQEFVVMLDETIEELNINTIYTRRNRRLPFSGARNFRDLGGYGTTDGRTVRWGMMYRSDGLNELTDKDMELLSELSLDRIIDFRTEFESQHRPDRLPAEKSPRLVNIPIEDSSTKVWHESQNDMIKKLRSIDTGESMIKTYQELVTQFTPEMKIFVQEVISAQGHPVLFHCMAGKDRTGFAAAILLRMLGVPQETIMEDYLLTNEYLLFHFKWRLFLVQLLRGKHFVEKVKGFMAADPFYLSAAFDSIDREYGSFENYVQNGLGLTENDVGRMKGLYLE